jgi:2-polyprenyl-6-methoxyphenol hydroxylase-like FAD-dependent oxidoreductase
VGRTVEEAMQQVARDVVIVGGGIGGSGLAARLAEAGLDVEVVERTTAFPDRVRGEMWTPWGVAVTEGLGLLAPLVAAGARFTTRWAFYDDVIPTDVAESMALDVSVLVPGVAGILNVTHPIACSALFDHAAAKGAHMRRGVVNTRIELGGTRPTLHWVDEDGQEGDLVADLVVGADGRASAVRRAAGIELHRAPVRQYMTGLLVEGERPLSSHIDSYGTGTDVNWYAFPQGPSSVRVYLAHHDVHRYAGAGGTARFMADLAQCASPDIAGLASGRALSPIATHQSVDTWTERPYAPGAVLIGDAGGYNDPIIGQGLSLTMCDVRDVSAAVLADGPAGADFSAYGIARFDRHAKQRSVAQTMAELMCSFGPENAGRRLRALPLMASDERVQAIAASLMLGPEVLPPGTEALEAARAVMLAA